MKETKPKAICVDIIDPQTSKSTAERRLDELTRLVKTYGGVGVAKIIQKKAVPDYDTYIGKGKIEEICEFAQQYKKGILVINNILKARQIFKLNEIFRKKKIEFQAWDRVDLILKIFDKHSQTTEAKLQIELAGIRHMGPRIFGMGIELSRQAGAMGLRAGQGESNIELMKRHLRTQELSILQKLKHYETINEGHRQRRRRKNLKTIALVGYTNAGKSSLLKSLTSKDVFVADRLFATLDTRIGKIHIPNDSKNGEYKQGTDILMSDTIGFIQDLPPFLIKAFKSTLAETVDADLILHIIDISDPEMHEKIKVVEEILEQLNLEDKPKIYGFNKMDLMAPATLFMEKEAKLKNKRIVKAGIGASELLGWGSGEKEKAKTIMEKLKKKYKKFNPAFFSAEEKWGMEDLIEKLNKTLKKQ
jgi:GTPase